MVYCNVKECILLYWIVLCCISKLRVQTKACSRTTHALTVSDDDFFPAWTGIRSPASGAASASRESHGAMAASGPIIEELPDDYDVHAEKAPKAPGVSARGASGSGPAIRKGFFNQPRVVSTPSSGTGAKGTAAKGTAAKGPAVDGTAANGTSSPVTIPEPTKEVCEQRGDTHTHLWVLTLCFEDCFGKGGLRLVRTVRLHTVRSLLSVGVWLQRSCLPSLDSI